MAGYRRNEEGEAGSGTLKDEEERWNVVEEEIEKDRESE